MIDRVKQILATVKPLAAEYHQLTGKPLGVTGEVAEYVAAENLHLELTPARTSGHDAVRRTPTGDIRIQIKGRAFGEDSKPSQRLSRIKENADCDVCFWSCSTMRPLSRSACGRLLNDKVIARLKEPGSRARNERGALSVRDFKRIAKPVWPASSP
jgi:hypothetical protein